MKALIYAACALPLLLLNSCSKEEAKPTGLNDTEWRLTAQIREEYLKGTSPKRIQNIYQACSGNNLITFTSSGQVFWTREKGGCAIYDIAYDRLKNNLWGEWQLKNSSQQLAVLVEEPLRSALHSGYSALPVILEVQEAYDVLKLNSTTLILSKTYTVPTQANPTQDSVYVFQHTFTRVIK